MTDERPNPHPADEDPEQNIGEPLPDPWLIPEPETLREGEPIPAPDRAEPQYLERAGGEQFRDRRDV